VGWSSCGPDSRHGPNSRDEYSGRAKRVLRPVDVMIDPIDRRRRSWLRRVGSCRRRNGGDRFLSPTMAVLQPTGRRITWRGVTVAHFRGNADQLVASVLGQLRFCCRRWESCRHTDAHTCTGASVGVRARCSRYRGPALTRHQRESRLMRPYATTTGNDHQRHDEEGRSRRQQERCEQDRAQGGA